MGDYGYTEVKGWCEVCRTEAPFTFNIYTEEWTCLVCGLVQDQEPDGGMVYYEVK